MTSSTSAGTAIALTATLPTAQTQAAYELTGTVYTEVGGVESIPAFGPQVGVNKFQPLKGAEQKHKGPATFGSLQVPFALDTDDAGQILLETASAPDNNAEYAFRVTYPNGDKRYFLGRVFGFQETPGSATNVLMGSAGIEINTKPVKVNAA